MKILQRPTLQSHVWTLVLEVLNHSIVLIFKHCFLSWIVLTVQEGMWHLYSMVSFSRIIFFYYFQSIRRQLTRKHWILGVSASAAVAWGCCLFSRSFWCDAADMGRPLLSLQFSSFSQCYHKDTQMLSYLLPEWERCQAVVPAVLPEADPAYHVSAPQDIPCCYTHRLLQSPSTHLLAPRCTARGS